MRKSASFVVALVAASSIAGASDATATNGSQPVTTLKRAAGRDEPVRQLAQQGGPIRCWTTWQSVRDAICITQPNPDAAKRAPPTPINAQGGEVQARPRDPRCRSAANRSQRGEP